MLLSMTGYGDARHEADGVTVAAEIRSVNNRYLKLNVRGIESAAIESKIDALVRKHVRRGALNVIIRFAREANAEDYRINLDVVDAFDKQLRSLDGAVVTGHTGLTRIDLATLLTIPGVVKAPSAGGSMSDEDWEQYVKPTVIAAIESLEKMRSAEGSAMADDFRANCDALSQRLEKIAERAPSVVAGYQTRLTERINTLLKDFDVSVTGADVAREVGVFAERSDISEEVVRLRSHLEQFAKISDEKESAGRKLEFLIQEMLRETNTIGSKSNDSEIAVHVVEIKTHIERMREMVQNVE